MHEENYKYYVWREPQFKNLLKNTINKIAEFYEKDILCSIDHFIATVRL
jgi:hypothetical protein